MISPCGTYANMSIEGSVADSERTHISNPDSAWSLRSGRMAGEPSPTRILGTFSLSVIRPLLRCEINFYQSYALVSSAIIMSEPSTESLLFVEMSLKPE